MSNLKSDQIEPQNRPPHQAQEDQGEGLGAAVVMVCSAGEEGGVSNTAGGVSNTADGVSNTADSVSNTADRVYNSTDGVTNTADASSG